MAGLRDFRTPSLEAVERRRLQLWILTAVLLVSDLAGRRVRVDLADERHAVASRARR